MKNDTKKERFKKGYSVTPTDRFWKTLFMKVLDSMYNEEATWSQPHWQKYGISNADAKKIEQEFDRFKNYQEKKNAELTIRNNSI